MARSAGTALFFFFLFVDLLLLLPLSSAHGTDADRDDGGGTDAQLHRYRLILTKIYCLIIVFLATFLPGITPSIFKWNDSFLLLGTQFAGGIFLATALLHFLSDANSSFQTLLPDNDYPFAFLLACAGYLLAMLADSIVHSMFPFAAPLQDVPSSSSSSSCAAAAMSTTDMESGGQQQQCVCSESYRTQSGNAIAYEHQKKNSKSSTSSTAAGMMMAITLQASTTSNSVDAVLLMLALCFHSVFEGIAIGIAGNVRDAWTALWTISIHKVFAAIAMGIALLRMMPSRPRLQCALYALAFGISSPIGVAIGIVVDSTTQGHVADWIYGVAMGLASGIFVYVAINHLLRKGYVPQFRIRVDAPFYKLLATTLGVAVMAIVMTWDQ